MTYRIKMALVMVVALAGMVFSATGLMDRALARVGLGELDRANHQYLDESYNRALEGFLLLSAAKSGLAVIEGSEVGIGFNLQIGDLVQSVYDYVDIAWKTVLAGGTILFMARLTLDGMAMTDHIAMVLAFFCMLMLASGRCFLPDRKGMARFLRSVTAICTFFTVLLYLVLPLAVYGASRLSERITRPLIQQSYDAFGEVSRRFTQAAVEDNLGGDGKGESAIETAMGVAGRYQRLKKRLRELEAYLGEEGKNLAGTTFQLIAAYLFDCVIFPLAFVAVLILFTKGMPDYLTRVQRERRLVETIRETVRRASTPPASHA
jgi:ABC-type multidrug transport system fused ATPase/permease subunit